jgi:hypothetical protein
LERKDLVTQDEILEIVKPKEEMKEKLMLLA